MLRQFLLFLCLSFLPFLADANDQPETLTLNVNNGSVNINRDSGSFTFALNRVNWVNERQPNTLTINGQSSNSQGHAKFSAPTDFKNGRAVAMNLSDIFKDQAEQVERRFNLIHNKGLVIKDRLYGLKPSNSVTWEISTAAKIEIRDANGEALLQQDQQTLRVKFTITGGTGKITVKPSNNPNINLLTLTVKSVNTDITINSSLLAE